MSPKWQFWNPITLYDDYLGDDIDQHQFGNSLDKSVKCWWIKMVMVTQESFRCHLLVSFFTVVAREAQKFGFKASICVENLSGFELGSFLSQETQWRTSTVSTALSICSCSIIHLKIPFHWCVYMITFVYSLLEISLMDSPTLGNISGSLTLSYVSIVFTFFYNLCSSGLFWNNWIWHFRWLRVFPGLAKVCWYLSIR